MVCSDHPMTLFTLLKLFIFYLKTYLLQIFNHHTATNQEIWFLELFFLGCLCQLRSLEAIYHLCVYFISIKSFIGLSTDLFSFIFVDHTQCFARTSPWMLLRHNVFHRCNIHHTKYSISTKSVLEVTCVF